MKTKIVFQEDKREWGSTRMRGFDIASGVKCDINNIESSYLDKNKRLIVTKMSDYSNVLNLSDNNEIVIDMVDFKIEKQLYLFKNFDFGIFTSIEQMKKYMNFFKYPEKCLVVYHHWDPRLDGLKTKDDKLEICYFGDKRKCIHFGEIDRVDFHHIDGNTFESNISKYLDYNCHYILKPKKHEDLIQPMTKLSNSASLNCPVISKFSHQYVELLGDYYPYFVESDDIDSINLCIDKIKSTFKCSDWYRAKVIMLDIKSRTSFESVLMQYKKIIE